MDEKEKEIEKIIRRTNEKNQDKVDWSECWSVRYPVLKRYREEIDVDGYSDVMKRLLYELCEEREYSLEDAMLVLKDILYHTYMNERKKAE